MSQLFQDNQDNTNQVDPLEYVKNKFKNDKGEIDLLALANSKVHSDRHITDLESELAELRQELKTRETLEKLVGKIAAPAQRTEGSHLQNPTSSQESHQNSDEREVNTFDPDKIARLVDEKLTREREIATKQTNVAKVAEELERAWGKGFPSKLKERAKELDLNQDFLAQLAETSPAAFLKLVNPTSQPTTNNNYAPPRSQVNTAALGSGRPSHKTYKDFEQLRKTSPSEYFSVGVQKEMHALARQYGDAFYQ